MSHSSDTELKQKGQASDDYKLVVYRSDDFQEIRSFNLSLSNIYVLASVVTLLLCALIFSLLSFTPLKRLIPGYGQIEVNQKFLELVDGVDELGTKIEAQGVYIGALKTLLSTGLSNSETRSLPILTPQPSETLADASTADINTSFSASEMDNQELGIELATNSEFYDILAGQKVLNPVNGLISSEFDPNIKHYGVDVLAPSRTPIIAMMDGFVINSGWDLETGYSIGIQHTNNILSFYKHNSRLLKEKGTFVRAGEAVAIIGNTGTLSNGPHLHFEIWHNGKPVNPQDILNFN